MKSLCGSRTDANKASQNGMTTLRTIVPQRLEGMMATCAILWILLEGWLAKHLTSLSLAVCMFRYLPEELDKRWRNCNSIFMLRYWPPILRDVVSVQVPG